MGYMLGRIKRSFPEAETFGLRCEGREMEDEVTT